jgi:hypothetical protein
LEQSSVIFAFLFAAFIVFITQRGELPIYLGFLLAPAATPNAVANPAAPPQQSAGATPASGGNVSDAVGKGLQAAAVIAAF